MLGHRRRRWSNIETMLDECPLFSVTRSGCIFMNILHPMARHDTNNSKMCCHWVIVCICSVILKFVRFKPTSDLISWWMPDDQPTLSQRWSSVSCHSGGVQGVWTSEQGSADPRFSREDVQSEYCCVGYPSKCVCILASKMLTQWWFNVGPTS